MLVKGPPIDHFYIYHQSQGHVVNLEIYAHRLRFIVFCCGLMLCDFNHNLHDDVIKWKHFPRYWPFVRGIHRRRPVTRSFDVFFDLRLNKQLSKQW